MIFSPFLFNENSLEAKEECLSSPSSYTFISSYSYMSHLIIVILIYIHPQIHFEMI